MSSAKRKGYLISLIILISQFNVVAQENADTSKVFNLGEVTVIGKGVNDHESVLHKREIELLNAESVAKVIEYIPGLTLGLAGGRNESMVYIRGFDLRQVPVFFDGIPVSVPYDGYFDLGQIQATSVSKLTVDKGNASILYGANTMGGAINIVSSKPNKKLIVDVSSGMATGQGSLDRNMHNLKIGTKHEKWFATASISYVNQNRLTLPSGFDTSVNELDRVRDNSQYQNLNYNIKVGATPKKGQEYSVSFNGVRSSKGIPVYLGDNPATRVRYWQYPHWDKDGIYFHTKNTLTQYLILKSRWYYDTYYNVLKSYDNNMYDSQAFGYAFTSTYDDYQLGGNIEAGLYRFKNHKIQAGAQFLLSNHKEFNNGEQPREMKDITTGFGIEDQWDINEKFSLNAGMGLFARKSLKAETYFADNDSVGSFETGIDESLHAQAGAEYRLNNHNRFKVQMARKTRFATMKDRYSFRIGRAIPNPDLTSESTINSEIGYYINYEKFSVNAEVFYNFISNTIQQVDNVVDDLWQLQNTGRSEFRGFEFAAYYRLLPSVISGFNYSYIEQRNISNPDLYFIDVPKHQLLGFVRWENIEKFYIHAEAKYNSSRYSTSDGEFKTDAFMLFNMSAEYEFFNYFSVNASVRNIFDKLYYYSEGYPEPGRVFSVGVRYNFASQN